MYVKVGSLSLPTDSTEWAVFRRPTWDYQGRLAQVTDRIDLRGQLFGTDADDLVGQSQSLRNACLAPSIIALYDDSGSILESIRASTSLSGIRVTGPDFPEGKGADLTTYRWFTLSAEATFPGVGTAAQLVEITERVTKGGGGPVYSFLQPKKGLPIKVMDAASTPYVATQQGSATSLVANPLPRPPLWPNALIRAPEITYEEPHFDGTRWLYGVSWSYSFGSALPLR